MNYINISKCRICKNTDLIEVLNLGNQALSGVFPKSKNIKITSGPLDLIKCNNETNPNYCGLLQLKQSYNIEEMYGDNYGYRSGLNPTMVKHLEHITRKALKYVTLHPDDMIIDIGSNDATLLKSYPFDNKVSYIGIDPTSNKFSKYYPNYIHRISNFFEKDLIINKFNTRKAKIITSIAMLYDLEAPLKFMQDVYEILDDEGIWYFEQSYMPKMIEMNAYDTICHEHLEYYGLNQINWMAKQIGFKILSLEFNNTNGGSFAVIAAKNNSKHKINAQEKETINKYLNKESEFSLMHPYIKFNQEVNKHKNDLIILINNILNQNKKIIGLGASTKGNILLQFCELDNSKIEYIAEVNEDKFGSYTPGTNIPIISEQEIEPINPDYMIVLPWHFRDFLIKKQNKYIESGGKLIFPLPKLEVVSK
ncbi:MAG: methyltransferase [Chloroflexi bacterium]|nr:methyltransferase [Chloroflexota bacterium]|tara:strand:- start:7446 stop:8711 length:1266 start_codon:yes stop_codon:yes gene_type:complete